MKQQGFILVSALLFLFLIAVLTLAGISNNTTQERMNTNLNNKEHSFQAAETGLKALRFFTSQAGRGPLKDNDVIVNRIGIAGNIMRDDFHLCSIDSRRPYKLYCIQRDLAKTLVDAQMCEVVFRC